MEPSQKERKMVPQILTMQAACKHFGIPSFTLLKWADQGHINSKKSSGGIRMFHRNDLEELFGNLGSSIETKNPSQTPDPGITKQRTNVVYCRVSSHWTKR